MKKKDKEKNANALIIIALFLIILGGMLQVVSRAEFDEAMIQVDGECIRENGNDPNKCLDSLLPSYYDILLKGLSAFLLLGFLMAFAYVIIKGMNNK